MNDLKYTEILKLNKELEGQVLNEKEFAIKVLSNIITSQLNEIFECSLRSSGLNAQVSSGNYDNIVQDSGACADSDLVLVFWELANLIDGFHYKANVLETPDFDALISKTKEEIDMVLENVKTSSLVIMNKFSSLVFTHNNLKPNAFDSACRQLNEYLEGKTSTKANVVLIDIDKIVARLSIRESVDLRYYYSSKALYSIAFYKEYIQYIKPVVTSVQGMAKKALILDCDNTLWKGILGEDGMDGIKMSAINGGVYFEEIQHLALELSNNGVILGLCSKNNAEDVEEVLDKHAHMTLREENLVIKRVNWEDKVNNLEGIAKELNIGIDSFVFVDDSSFETNLVKELLPQVSVLLVPKKLHEYPNALREVMRQFYNLGESKEDKERATLYKQEIVRSAESGKHRNIDDYLGSLELKVSVTGKDDINIERAAQLTQKTNQFNLTTKRYTESDITNFGASNNSMINTCRVSDRFGEYGITGLCIVRLKEKEADIDTLLMSCRIIGRNIELAYMDAIIKELEGLGIKKITATYTLTMKNTQVSDLYDRLGFELIDSTDEEKNYQLELDEYKYANIEYIDISYEK